MSSEVLKPPLIPYRKVSIGKYFSNGMYNQSINLRIVSLKFLIFSTLVFFGFKNISLSVIKKEFGNYYTGRTSKTCNIFNN